MRKKNNENEDSEFKELCEKLLRENGENNVYFIGECVHKSNNEKLQQLTLQEKCFQIQRLVSVILLRAAERQHKGSMVIGGIIILSNIQNFDKTMREYIQENHKLLPDIACYLSHKQIIFKQCDVKDVKSMFQKLQKDYTTAEEQKLKAEEQKMKAEEQQLKAEEQKMKAEEQKMKAEEQKLKAEEQKLKAEEQKLKVEEDFRQMQNAMLKWTSIIESSNISDIKFITWMNNKISTKTGDIIDILLNDSENDDKLKLLQNIYKEK